jgi:hypothetical protein
MRNIFDQYSQPENRLTHSLVMALHYDRNLLKSFLSRFGPEDLPDIKTLELSRKRHFGAASSQRHLRFDGDF